MAALAACIGAFAHHSFAAEFDGGRTVLLRGEVTTLEWTNPHIRIYLDVIAVSGVVEHWQCEGAAPNGLTRLGWQRNSLKPGDPVTIEGFLARDRSKTCNARRVKLPDGRTISREPLTGPLVR